MKAVTPMTDHTAAPAGLDWAISQVPKAILSRWDGRIAIQAGEVCARIRHGVPNDCSRDELRDMIEHHGRLWHANLVLGATPTLFTTLKYVYRAALRRGFDLDYFLDEFSAWETVIASEDATLEPIARCFQLLRAGHGAWMQLATSADLVSRPALTPLARRCFDAMTMLDEEQVAQLCREQVRDPAVDLIPWWRDVLAPCLQHVGGLWADGSLDWPQEHQITALIERVMDRQADRLPPPPEGALQITIGLPPEERHALPMRMLHDCLRARGHAVLTTPPGTPASELAALVAARPVALLIVPAIILHNIIATRKIVKAVRKANPTLPILVGGQAYAANPDLWRHTGADALATSLDDLFRQIDTLTPSAARPPVRRRQRLTRRPQSTKSARRHVTA